MDGAPQELNPQESRLPRDLAVLLLAIGFDPPRARARDQQADRAGGELRRFVLDRVAAIDPEPEELEVTLTAIIEELGGPSGPTRGVCSSFLEEWTQARAVPDSWNWLIAEALERSSAEGDQPRRRRLRGPA